MPNKDHWKKRRLRMDLFLLFTAIVTIYSIVFPNTDRNIIVGTLVTGAIAILIGYFGFSTQEDIKLNVPHGTKK